MRCIVASSDIGCRVPEQPDEPSASARRGLPHLFAGLALGRRLSHDAHILLLTLTAGFPGVLVSMILIWGGDYTAKVQWTLTLFIVGAWLGFSFAVRERVVTPLQTLSNPSWPGSRDSSRRRPARATFDQLAQKRH